MSTEDSKQAATASRRWFSDGLLIGVLTAATYWIAFSYEAAYLGRYGFPPHCIEVSFESALTVFLLLSGSLWVFFAAANLLCIFWPRHPALQLKVCRVAVLLGLGAWHLSNYGFRTGDVWLYVVLLCLIVCAEVLWPLLVYRDSASVKERLIADELAEVDPRSKTLFGRLFKALGPAGYYLVLAVFLGGWLAHSAGDAKARTERKYLVYVSDPTLAVVRMYRERALCIRIDRAKRVLEGIVVRPAVDAEAELREEEVGPIKEGTPPVSPE